MAMKKNYKPTSPGIRFQSHASFSDLTRTTPEKALTTGKPKTGGRNSKGRITSRFIGGGHKQKYREIDFKRDKHGIPAKVAHIEYDPNRSARIALLHYVDGEKRYIVAPQLLRVGDTVLSGPEAEIKPGNAMPLRSIPLGTFVYNVEMVPGKGGQIARGAGTYCQLMAKEGSEAVLRLPSGEMRKLAAECACTIGQVGNEDHQNVIIGKAGKSRWLGRRPNVRGVAMNPVDHPMGGGEGKTSGGRHPVTPWGMPTKGYKTRRRKPSDKYIVRRRK